MKPETGFSVQVLRSDRGGEYTSKEFERFLVDHNIKHELTCAYTPEQNGAAE